MTAWPACGFWDELTAGLPGSFVVLDARLVVPDVDARWALEFGSPAEEAVGLAYFARLGRMGQTGRGGRASAG